MDYHIVAGALTLAITLGAILPASASSMKKAAPKGTLDGLGPDAIQAAVSKAIADPDNPAPEYPYTARRMGHEGRVMLEVEVRPDGSVGDLRLEQSSGSGTLDRAAMATVSKWHFEPPHQEGERARSLIRVPITFELVD